MDLGELIDLELARLVIMPFVKFSIRLKIYDRMNKSNGYLDKEIL